jgi:phage baseplate assembly protein W
VPARHDYAYPFRIGPSGQALQARYEAHVAQMVRQVLLTTPGERIDLPEFGCGLRRLVFAPHSEALDASTQMIVRQSLQRWLADQVDVKLVRVEPAEETGDEAQLVVIVQYVVRDTLTEDQVAVRVIA